MWYIYCRVTDKESEMDIISSAILGGLIWDGMKAGLPLTLDYVKKKAQGYILDESTLAKLDELSQTLPETARTSEEALITYIENNQQWKALSKQIVKSRQFTQNITGENAKGVQADKIDTLNM